MITKKIKIEGIVQGVGFRPYIYNLALKYDIKGWVNNDDEGVNILTYSSFMNFQDFLKEIKNNPPKLAKINKIKVKKLVTKIEYKDFQIKKSKVINHKSTIISPDIAICEDCIEDINNKDNFRYNYALTNCINCGPRYSIINTIPYDRKNTSMVDFPLCSDCKKEYMNPLNRRYHAQPIACAKCGPDVILYNKYNKILSGGIKAIKKLADLIKEGEIIALKGLGGFHLICDATNDSAIKTLRFRKNRKTKPFAVLFKNLNEIYKHTKISQKEAEILVSKEKPIVIVKKKKDSTLSKDIAPNIDYLGCFISYTALHHLLFKYLENPIIATSANLKDEPIIRHKNEILNKMNGIVDFVLDFNRDIINSCDDSIVQIIDNDILILRNARAYAPLALKIKTKSSKKILALGANQKSTISLIFDNNLILSPHIGDLKSLEAMEYFTRTLDTFKRFYDFKPDIIVCDKHPNYETTKLALRMEEKYSNIKLVQVQHHYAHILSTMAEYGLKEKVLGFVFDGTGYGDDGNIWGGEVFLANKNEYKRVQHIKYFKLLGGEVAIKEPKRIALSLLFDSFSLEDILAMQNNVIKAFKKNEIEFLYKMWEKDLNSPFTSSVGRLFDAICSFANILHTQTYEGETGLQIEKYYDSNIKQYYSFLIEDSQIDISLMIKELIQDEDKRIICSKFINTIIEIIVNISEKYKDLSIILTGGVFQNRVLLEKTLLRLKEKNRKVYYSKRVPLNDGGLSVGQAYFQT